MLNTKEPVTIPRDITSENDLDFQYLKDIGIEYLQSMAGDLWTDYNEHDPGVTMLEVLSYAITDLGNRISLPMQDLLTDKMGADYISQFYKASEILTTNPLTAIDYRKLFMDIKGVRNCWMRPFKKKVYVNCKDHQLSYNPDSFQHIKPELKNDFTLKGLNKLLVDFEIDEFLDPSEQQAEIDRIKSEIREVYHKNRNLCEDLVDISEVEKQCICICSDIELEKTADEDEVHARILFAIHNYFSPGVRFYSLKEMLSKGYRTDEIYEGVFLRRGFIDTSELIKADLRGEVRLSDIMNIVADIPGVKLIHDISISDCDGNKDSGNWLIYIQDNKRPEICKESVFNYKKDVIPVSVDPQKVETLYKELVSENDAYNAHAAIGRDLETPSGTYHETGSYTTVQNDFPETYGIGANGLSGSVPVSRKSKARQLKGYLLFFDQVLTSYFAHLDKIKELLSVDNPLKVTYFTQAVQDVAGMTGLVNHYPLNNDKLLTEHLMGFLDDSVKNRNELLDHLLARFAEKFSEYAFLMKGIYGTAAPEMVLRSKETFLKEYVSLSAERGTGFDYYEQLPDELWDTGNVSGAEKRIARLSGMKNYFRRDLSTSAVSITEIIVSPGVTEYQWKVRDEQNNEILLSVRNYPDVSSAAEQIYQAILLIIETTEKEILEVVRELSDNSFVIAGNLELHKTSTTYHFKVIDPTLPFLDPNRIVAGNNDYYPTEELFISALLKLIDFMKYDFTEEGMFLVEHILLRPMEADPDFDDFLPVCPDDCTSCCSIDPYSFRVSVILPGFTQRFGNIDVRNFMEELIREELPSHIVPKICWIGNRKGAVPDADNDLLRFQKAYKDFLLVKTDPENNIEPELRALIHAMNELNTIYPKGRLYDCSDTNMDGKIILGRSQLGTLGTGSTEEE